VLALPGFAFALRPVRVPLSPDHLAEFNSSIGLSHRSAPTSPAPGPRFPIYLPARRSSMRRQRACGRRASGSAGR
jgi:hypothetical protein